MSELRKFIVALAGTEDAGLPEEIAKVVGASAWDIEITLLHVEEIGLRELAADAPVVRRGPWPQPRRSEIQHRMADADDAGAAALLALWQERFELALPTTKITQLVGQGRPEQEIVAAAKRLNSDAVVLCARPQSGPTEPGPRSVGHVARFVVDHSPVAVLLMRRSS
jgi:nucleotide-binding universal stress UspA family protein